MEDENRSRGRQSEIPHLNSNDQRKGWIERASEFTAELRISSRLSRESPSLSCGLDETHIL